MMIGRSVAGFAHQVECDGQVEGGCVAQVEGQVPRLIMDGLAQGVGAGNTEDVAVAIRSLREYSSNPGRSSWSIGNEQQIEGLAEGGTGSSWSLNLAIREFIADRLRYNPRPCRHSSVGRATAL
jgi:hypothetical protein